MSLEIAGVTKVFRGAAPGAARLTALDNIILNIAPGETLILTGANGAGKTTLLKCCAGVITCDMGTITICGHDIARAPAAAKKAIGFAGDSERGFFARISGRDNLALFAALCDVAATDVKDRVDAALETFGLTDASRKPVRSYSAGMKQRLALARATIHRPTVLLLDEPTKSLDAAFADTLPHIIESHCASGGCALVTTHDRLFAKALECRTAVLDSGRIAGQDFRLSS